MKYRPNRPTEQFLQNIGIFHLPDDIDITFDDSKGYLDRIRNEWVSPRAFHVEQVDENSNAIGRAIVPAFETPQRTKKLIWNDLKDTLVEKFNAVAVEYCTASSLKPVGRPHRPTQAFLSRLGLKRIPQDIDIVFRDLGPDCSHAFVIRKLANDGSTLFETEVPARQTRAHNARNILEKVTTTLLKLGAQPQTDAQPSNSFKPG